MARGVAIAVAALVVLAGIFVLYMPSTSSDTIITPLADQHHGAIVLVHREAVDRRVLTQVNFPAAVHDNARVVAARAAVFAEMEKCYEDTDVLPVWFGFPSSKLLLLEAEESIEKVWATIVPGDISTYNFHTEEAYYHDYAVSRFAYTWKKGGWDCMRKFSR
jgi:hypothetical protein